MTARWLLRAALILTALAPLVVVVAEARLRSRPGLVLTAYDADGRPLLRRIVPEVDLDFLGSSRPRPARVHLSGFWLVPEGDRHRVAIKAGGHAEVSIDGEVAVRRRSTDRSRGKRREVDLVAGFHRLEIELVPGPRSVFLRFQHAVESEPLRTVEPWALFPDEAARADAAARAAAGLAWRTAFGALATALVLVCAAAVLERRRTRYWPGWWTWLAVPALLFAWAGSLRIEALVGRYWQPDTPGWALRIARGVESLRPGMLEWRPDPHPYAGDPYGYLLAAREDKWFYDAHMREPLFVFATKGLLHLTGGHDIAVNIASVAFSTLAVVGTYLLGAATFTPVVGVAAASLLTIERQSVALSAEGWRDDLFTCLVVFFALAVVRLRGRPTFWRGLAAGLAGGLACLTRVTAFSFLLPAYAWLVLRGPGRRQMVLSCGWAVLLAAPYLVSCAIAFSDPFHAINSHTKYYRGKRGLETQTSMRWDDYLLSAQRPFALLDTMTVGLTHYPLAKKWAYFEEKLPLLGAAFSVATVAGLLLFLRSEQGRLLVVILFSSLLPYAFTWEVPGGSGFRFTMHALPLYLIAACLTVVAVMQSLGPSRSRERLRALLRPKAVLAALGLLATALLVWGAAAGLLYVRVREAISAGAAARVSPGYRDFLFFGEGWAWPKRPGNAWSRATASSEAAIVMPLVAEREYTLVLRLGLQGDAAADRPTRVLFNGRSLATIQVDPDAMRHGAYSIRLPREAVRQGSNRVMLQSAEPGIILWFFRIEPG